MFTQNHNPITPATTGRHHIIAPVNCTGCGLCANVCPKDAISMVWSPAGFPIPQVDEFLCIDCGLCVRKCIALESPLCHDDDISKVRFYAAWHKQEDFHQKSSSGGIFSALAEYIFSQGGCVFGVIWQNAQTAVFKKAENMDELAPMRGSKYTPAMPNYIYREVQRELQAGRQVLFTGTPCQTHALKCYLKGNNADLTTIDIVCHGVPSRLVLQKYIKEDELSIGKKILHISFRDKLISWLNYSVTKHYADASTSSCSHRQDAYMKMFLSNTALNHSCYDCPYAHLPRQGDISLGDYWGVQNFHPDWPIRWGISGVLVNTDKGQQLLNKVNKSISLIADSFENLYFGQRASYIRQHPIVNPNRPHAMAALQAEECSLAEAIHQACDYTFVLGHRVNNRLLPLQTISLTKRVIRKLYSIYRGSFGFPRQ